MNIESPAPSPPLPRGTPRRRCQFREAGVRDTSCQGRRFRQLRTDRQPGLVEGCAAGDLLEIDADGLFQVVRRGPNLCIQAFGRPSFDAESLESLNSGFVPLGGLVEAPADRRFIVVTVSAAAGFPAVEAVMERWAASVSVLVEWGFSNVFGADEEPLNWWHESEA
ncbi:hypothetical protein SCYAM73S_08395 [Streptomyces cyaneofuscatus]|uniref:DUF4265 domain-containing protein n=1 Tax=Streptomyces cyaneofuscatus TaxID=66883 RepID=UPI000D12B052